MIKNINNNTNEIKAILVGNSGVGKTNLINTCVGNPFVIGLSPTITNTFVEKKFIINNKEYSIVLWDTVAQEDYLSINKIFYRGAEIVIFVFDVTDQKSLDDLNYWISNVKEILGTNVVAGIVGNKIDLIFVEQIKEETIKKFSESKGLQYRLVSAKTYPEGLSKFLEYLITHPINENELKDNDKKNEKENEEGKNEENNNNNNKKDNNNKITDNEEVKQHRKVTLLNRKRGESIKLNNRKEPLRKKCC